MNRDLILVTISLGTWGLGEGLFVYFQPIYLQQLGANPVAIGAILGIVGIAMAVAQIPAGYLSDRIGSRPVMWFSWILGLSATFLMALAPSLPFFVAGMAIYGLTSFVTAPLNSYVTGARGKWSVGRAISVVSGIFNLGAVLGPLLGGLIAERFGIQVIYWIAFIIFIPSTAIIFFIRPHHEEHHAETSHPAEGLFRNSRFLIFMGIAFMTTFAVYLPQPLTPNFLQNQHQLTPSAIGILGMLGNLGNALLTLSLGTLSPIIGILLGQVFVGLFSTLMWQATGMAWFGVGYFFIGGYRLYRAMVLAYTRPLIHPAMIFSPILAGFLYNREPGSIYLTAIVLIGVMLAVNLVLLPRLKAGVVRIPVSRS
jgi:MFS family permease